MLTQIPWSSLCQFLSNKSSSPWLSPRRSNGWCTLLSSLISWLQDEHAFWYVSQACSACSHILSFPFQTWKECRAGSPRQKKKKKKRTQKRRNAFIWLSRLLTHWLGEPFPAQRKAQQGTVLRMGLAEESGEWRSCWERVSQGLGNNLSVVNCAELSRPCCEWNPAHTDGPVHFLYKTWKLFELHKRFLLIRFFNLWSFPTVLKNSDSPPDAICFSQGFGWLDWGEICQTTPEGEGSK